MYIKECLSNDHQHVFTFCLKINQPNEGADVCLDDTDGCDDDDNDVDEDSDNVKNGDSGNY